MTQAAPASRRLLGPAPGLGGAVGGHAGHDRDALGGGRDRRRGRRRRARSASASGTRRASRWGRRRRSRSRPASARARRSASRSATRVPPAPVGRSGRAVATSTPCQGRDGDVMRDLRGRTMWVSCSASASARASVRPPAATARRETGTATGRAAPPRASAYGSCSRPAAAATRRATASPHIRPWHQPMPARVSSLAVRASPAPRSVTASRTAATGTSSHRHTRVSSRCHVTQPSRTGWARCMAAAKPASRSRRAATPGCGGRGSRPAATAAAAVPAIAPSSRARSAPPTPVSSPAARTPGDTRPADRVDGDGRGAVGAGRGRAAGLQGELEPGGEPPADGGDVAGDVALGPREHGPVAVEPGDGDALEPVVAVRGDHGLPQVNRDPVPGEQGGVAGAVGDLARALPPLPASRVPSRARRRPRRPRPPGRRPRRGPPRPAAGRVRSRRRRPGCPQPRRAP